MAVTSVRNETAWRLMLVSLESEEMVLAPLPEDVHRSGLDSPFAFEALQRRDLVSLPEEAPSKLSEQLGTAVIGGTWVGILGAVMSGEAPSFGIPGLPAAPRGRGSAGRGAR